jgi:hypothetical protein
MIFIFGNCFHPKGALLNLRALVKFRLPFTLMVLALLCSTAFAQSSESDEPNSESNPPVTLFPHSDTSRFWVSGQMNFIFQAHPGFPAKYSGTNSFQNVGETGLTRVLTLYTGLQITPRDELLFDLEQSGGAALSNALGLAGYTDLDAVRIPGEGSPLSTSPYMARVMYHHIFALSHEYVAAERSPLSLFTKLPSRRLEFRIGKFSTVDFFDQNSVGSDSHLQFMNWSTAQNGAFDYAANTRGYTYGAILDYEERNWGVRFGEMLMPKVANGDQLDADLARARAENIEFELRSRLLKDRKTVFRALSYVNHGNMDDYRESIIRFLQGIDPTPIIENTRQQGTIKYGFGLNAEQELTRDLRLGARWGWNEGRHESFAYTEVDSTAELCADYVGRKWKRAQDKTGLAFVSNGISKDHQEYLRLGGLGFLLGDGNLNYGRETIGEFYYTAHIWRGIFVSFDLQRINNPGYNRDRGPVLVPSLRLHIDL